MADRELNRANIGSNPDNSELSESSSSNNPRNSLVPAMQKHVNALEVFKRYSVEEGSIQLPACLDDAILRTVRGGAVELVASILQNENIVDSFLETKMFLDVADITDTLRSAAFGQPNDKTIEKARALCQIVLAGHPNSHIAVVLADIFAERTIDSEGFMQLGNEILRATDKDLAQNLEGLHKGNADIRFKSFQWLFDRFVEHAESALTKEEGREKHLVCARVIFKHFTRVLSNTDTKKWLDLQTHMIMRFAERIASEHKNEIQPFMAALLAFHPELTQEFILAVNTNFEKITPQFQIYSADESNDKTRLLKKYGGFENYAQAIETVLSFGVIVWRDKMYKYLYEKFEHADSIMKAQYLNCMKYALAEFDTERGMIGFHRERIDFVKEQIILLAHEKYKFIQTKLDQVLDHSQPEWLPYCIADEVVDYLLEDGRYFELYEDRRQFLSNFLLRAAINGQIEGGREKVLSLIMFELKEEQNIEIKKAIFESKYFNDELLTNLNEEHGKIIRDAVISDYHIFSENDVLDGKLVRLMTFFGLSSMEDCYIAFEQHVTTDYKKARVLLSLSGKVASKFKAENEQELREFNKQLDKIATLALRASLVKQKQITDYYSLRTRLSKAHREIEGLNEQNQSVTAGGLAINNRVEELDKEISSLEAERTEFQQKLKALTGSVEGGLVYRQKIRDEIKLRPWREVLPWNKPENWPETSHLYQLYINLWSARHSMFRTAREESKIRRELAGINSHLSNLEPAREKAEAKQVRMTEAVTEVQERTKRVNKFIGDAETMRTSLLGLVEKDRSFANDYHAILQLFLSSPSITKKHAERMHKILNPAPQDSAKKNPDNVFVARGQDSQLLISRLDMAQNKNLERGDEFTQLLAKLGKLFAFPQSSRGLFREEVHQQLLYLIDRAKADAYIPNDRDDPLFNALDQIFRSSKNQADTASQAAQVANRLQYARKMHALRTKKLVSKVKSSVMAGTTNISEPFKQFFRLKFGKPTKDGERDSVEILSIVLALLALDKGLDSAIETIFYMLSGHSGAFFAKPEEKFMKPLKEGEKRSEPKNRAEAIDLRFAMYYKSIGALRKQVFADTQESFRLEEGFGWDAKANSLALSYFVTICNSKNADQGLRGRAEHIVLQDVIIPWSKEYNILEIDKEEEHDEDLEIILDSIDFQTRSKPPKVEKVAAKLSIEEYSIYSAAFEYSEGLNLISKKEFDSESDDRKPVFHAAMDIVDFAYHYAKRIVITHKEVSGKNYEEVVLKTLVNLERVMDPRIVKQDGEDLVLVLGLIQEARLKLKERDFEETPDPLKKLNAPSISKFELGQVTVRDRKLLNDVSNSEDRPEIES